jgi:peptide/nickel transport system permease protein
MKKENRLMLDDEQAIGEQAELFIEEEEDEDIYLASQWQLVWRKFRSHRLAILGVVILMIIYASAIFAEFVAPQSPHTVDRRYVNAQPQMPHFVSDEGFHTRPFVYGYTSSRDPKTFRMRYEIDHTKKYPIHFFVRGESYKFWGLWETDLHLFGVEDGVLFLFGSDPLGRDLFSRVIYGTRISTSIGLLGVLMSFALGVTLGGISGYYGGMVDQVIQRIIEFIRSVPSVPLWMGLAAALPAGWPITRTYLAITAILSLIGWSGLAREVRSKFLSLREEDFVMSARLVGCSEFRIIAVHMVPSFLSHIIASLTLAIPNMILAETSLSFLGLGLRAPAISWGVLLQQAQNVRTVALAPWLLIPALFVVITVLAFNFVGDGLRDAADPYGR